jgi:hypothetical protein
MLHRAVRRTVVQMVAPVEHRYPFNHSLPIQALDPIPYAMNDLPLPTFLKGDLLIQTAKQEATTGTIHLFPIIILIRLFLESPRQVDGLA